MAAMGTLVGGVAHEVRNPLFGISATLDAVEASFGRDSEFVEFSDILRYEVDRLINLMQELFEYGRSMRELRPESPDEVVSTAPKACSEQAADQQVKMSVESASTEHQVLMDRDRLRRAFENLARNAIQHSPCGGVVQVSSIGVTWKGRQWLEYVIRDHGIGFQSGDLHRVFEPFYSKRRGGTGLGLAIAQRIVEDHGGRIEAGNHPEGGAIVKVRLPFMENGISA